MVFISLQPFAVKRVSLLIAAIVCLLTASCFADSVFLTVGSTPHDRQMGRIRPVLLSLKSNHSEHQTSLAMVNHWIEDLRGIPYGFSQEWKTPREVEAGAAADCKGEAVTLSKPMEDSGASNVRLVIGKRDSTSRLTHTWLVWETDSGTDVLYPTINRMAYQDRTAL
jgi:predicted transglutaminase-like cysteine proteinase